MHAVIMAGGRGRRLRPYTAVLPKPLMPLGDRPILGVLMHQLVHAGVDGITISVGHLGGLIESWVSHDAGYGVPIEFAYEEDPLGTAGALGTIRRPQETFLALNGDVLTTLDYQKLIEINREHGAIATVAIKERHVDIEYGIVHRDERGRIERLEEKPRLGFTVSMGVYAMEPEIIDLIAPGERIDFPDLLLRAKAAGHDVLTYVHEGYWRDIGNRDDYEAAIEDFDDDPDRFLAPTKAIDSRGVFPETG